MNEKFHKVTHASHATQMAILQDFGSDMPLRNIAKKYGCDKEAPHYLLKMYKFKDLADQLRSMRQSIKKYQILDAITEKKMDKAKLSDLIKAIKQLNSMGPS